MCPDKRPSLNLSVHFLLFVDHSNVLTGLAMVGKFGITASFAVIYVYTAEIFPTVLRQVNTDFIYFHITHDPKVTVSYDTFNSFSFLTVRQTGIGVSCMFARMGGVLAPIINMLHNHSPTAPLLIFGVSPVLGAVLALALPETANRPLPDTVEEAENWDKRYSNITSVCSAFFSPY